MDTWAIAISVVALIVAIATPFVTYFFLISDIRTQQLKAVALKVDEQEMSSLTVEEERMVITAVLAPRIQNQGSLAVGDVQFVFEFQGDNSTFFDDVKVSADPPLDVTANPQGNRLSVSFDKPIAAGQVVTLYVEKVFEQRVDDIRETGFHNVRGWYRSEAAPMAPYMSRTTRSGA